MKNVLIVGYGTVGHNLAQEISKLKPDIYDKYKTEFNTKKDIKYDFCFICVDTPYTDAYYCDFSQVQDALEENDADIYIIKSTILPTVTEYLIKAHQKHIIFSPEYYGGTQHCNNFDFNFTILGGVREDCIKVQQLLQEVYDARHTFRLTDSTTAELAKYMENSWLATKVSFCNEFYDIAEKTAVDYEELRELFILDPRVNPSHTFVYRDHPYYDSHCLNKDVPAIATFAESDFLKFIVKYNEKRKSSN
jgi:nucleotide sugar dehydrogenase